MLAQVDYNGKGLAQFVRMNDMRPVTLNNGLTVANGTGLTTDNITNTSNITNTGFITNNGDMTNTGNISLMTAKFTHPPVAGAACTAADDGRVATDTSGMLLNCSSLTWKKSETKYDYYVQESNFSWGGYAPDGTHCATGWTELAKWYDRAGDWAMDWRAARLCQKPDTDTSALGTNTAQS